MMALSVTAVGLPVSRVHVSLSPIAATKSLGKHDSHVRKPPLFHARPSYLR